MLLVGAQATPTREIYELARQMATLINKPLSNLQRTARQDYGISQDEIEQAKDYDNNPHRTTRKLIAEHIVHRGDH